MLAGTYLLPVGRDGDAITMYAVYSRSKLATVANAPGLGVLGNANIAGARYAMTLRGVDNYSHALSVGADYKDIMQSVTVNGAGDVATPITYMPLVAAYNGYWLGAEYPTSLDITATIGMRGMFGNNDSEFAAKRFGASASFLALRGGLQHTESIGRWSLMGRLEGQLASGPLVSNEQFYAGGAESVRGYLEGELLGDNALRVSMELRTPKYKPAGVTSFWSLNGLAFFDAAWLQTLQPVFPQPERRTLRGAGLGLRLTAPYGFAFEFDWGHALDEGDLTRKGDNRLHARLVWTY